MSDIRKRVGKNGTTYQVRYPSKARKSGYAFKSFATRKQAVEFIGSGRLKEPTRGNHAEIKTMPQAVDMWLRICEKEGLNGREPVTLYTLKNYEYRAAIIKAYPWPKDIHQLTTPDIVAFRSWLLTGDFSRVVASKVLSTLHSVFKEMTIRGVLPHNVAIGVSVRADSRYQEAISIPSKAEIMELLAAADVAVHSRKTPRCRFMRLPGAARAAPL